ncbi:hypothetical protein BGX33_000934 [Mortierella sp. NVP41]|nr:hypothetical protein BGX33_000934 [Mortierella sp. NVP41]
MTTPSSRRFLQQNAFESLGIYKPLAKNLKTTMAIQEPSALQQAFIPPILIGKDVLIRDTTGSGKTFGVLLSVLNKPRRRIHAGGSTGNGITSVVIVPNQELAFQLEAWTRELFPSMDESVLQELIQVVVTPPPSPFDPKSPSKSTPGGYTSTGKKARHRPRPGSQPTVGSKADQDQIQRLSQSPPHVLVATPTRLWDLLQRGVLDLSGIETLVLDEVDHLIRLPNRYASRRQILNRDVHPKPAELAVREILRSAQAASRYPLVDLPSDDDSLDNNDIGRTGSGADRIQIVAASATMNRLMRHWLESRGWIQDPAWVDTTKSVVLPEGIEHHCVIVGADSVRNMRFDTKSAEMEGSEGQDKEVNWAETDQEWRQSKDKDTISTSKDKDLTWKEQKLNAPGVVSPELDEKAVEKFRDDDDRMLEGVAMACQLDEVKSACVFFCTSFSLTDLATRLEFEFGLPVKTIQNAFQQQNQDGLGKDKEEKSTTAATILTAAGKKSEGRAGIYLAHEANARGLDLPGLSHVFIVGLPSSPSSYLHMAGRTGRMGQTGQVVTILRDDEFLEDRARSLFRMLNVHIEPYRHVE